MESTTIEAKVLGGAGVVWDPLPMQSAPGGILTITANPALDITTSVPSVHPERKLRCSAPTSEAGGGGINVARVAHRLGADVTALFPIGGTVGGTVSSRLAEEGVHFVGVAVQAETRMSFTVDDLGNGSQFRFVLPGPDLSNAERLTLIEKAAQVGAERTCIVISGSMPPTTPPDFMADLTIELRRAHAEQSVAEPSTLNILIDTSGAALKAAVNCPGVIVKPSVRELEELVGKSLEDQAQVVKAAATVVDQSACRALVVSIGSGGVFVVEKNAEPTRLRAPTVKVRSAVGAGDSLVAGIAVGLSKGQSLIESARWGVAAGTAAVLTEGTGLCHPDDVTRLLPLVE